MFRYLLCFFSIFYFQICHSYEFANIAKSILQEYNTKNVKTNFAKDLYKEVSNATENFTNNLTCNQLEQLINQEYIDFMSKKITEQNTNVLIALVWPVTVGNDNLILKHFEKYFNVIRQKRILLDAKGAKNFLSQIPTKATHPTGVDLWFSLPYRNYNPMRIFLLECKPNNTNYNEMKRYLVRIFSNNQRYIDNFETNHGRRAIQNLYSSTVCKREIRQAVNIDYAMHICDDHHEAKELAKLVFNNRSIDCIKYSQYDNIKNFAKFKRFMAKLKNKANNVMDDIVVYNSAVLSSYGLRDCGDIDFLHNPRIYLPHNYDPDLSNQNRFFKRNYVIVEDANKHYILEDCPNAFANENLDTTHLLIKKVSIDELIYNPLMHFYYHGVRFASLDFMLYFKEKRGRPKDIKDALLIKNHYLYR